MRRDLYFKSVMALLNRIFFIIFQAILLKNLLCFSSQHFARITTMGYSRPITPEW
jgi:hypothetical protein